MKRRSPNWLLAFIAGSLISLATIPDRIAEFTDPNNPTIDQFIVKDFGLTGAILYHFVIAAITWMLISWIILSIFRRRPRAQLPPASPPKEDTGPTKS